MKRSVIGGGDDKVLFLGYKPRPLGRLSSKATANTG